MAVESVPFVHTRLPTDLPSEPLVPGLPVSPLSPLSPLAPLIFVNVKVSVCAEAVPPVAILTDGVPVVFDTVF